MGMKRSKVKHSRDHDYLRKELEATIFQRDLVFPIAQRAAMMVRWALVALLAR